MDGRTDGAQPQYINTIDFRLGAWIFRHCTIYVFRLGCLRLGTALSGKKKGERSGGQMQCRMMYHIFDETESRRTCDLYIFWLERHMRQRWRAPGPSGRAAGRGQDLQDSGELTSAGTNTAPFMGYCVPTDNPPPVLLAIFRRVHLACDTLGSVSIPPPTRVSHFKAKPTPALRYL